MKLTYCFSFFSANIEARIKNKVIFKIYISGAVKKVLLLILGVLKARCYWPKTNENRREAIQDYYQIFTKFGCLLWF